MALVPFPSATPAPPPDDDPRAATDPYSQEDDLDGAGGRMSFLEHLDELRKRLIASAIGLAVGCAIAFVFVGRIQEFIMLPLSEAMGGERLIYTQGFDPFMLWIKIGALGGLFIASPFILWQVWLFIAPGLYQREKRMAIPFVLFSTILFLAGALFSHYVAFPWAWKFFKSFETNYLRFLPAIGPVFSLYVKMILAFGIVFQMPTLIFFLARMGVVSARLMVRHTKYAVLLIFVLAAVISPGGDIASQMLMAGPMLVLYGISIGVAWLFGRQPTE